MIHPTGPHVRPQTLLLFLALLFCLPLRAEKHFAFTPSARDAYQQVTSLRIAEARITLQRLKLSEPENLIAYHLENYVDFFTLFISEEEERYQQLKDRRQQRLEAIREGNPDSPYYLYAQADIHLQWALLRLKFDEYLGAFSEVSKAHKLLKKNQELFPDFMPNLKDLAILHAIIGTIPDTYRWGVKLLSGLDGTISQGQQEMEKVLRFAETNDFIFETESQVLYAFLLLHLANDEAGAWRAVNNAGLQPQANPLHCFLMANIAMRTGHNDRAVQLLEQRPRSRAFLPFPYLHFMHGLAKLRRLDTDANPHFLQFLREFKGRNFIKEAYQKMAWQELLNGNPAGYQSFIQECLANGFTTAGSDKNAAEEAKQGTPPPLVLLKARLLFDGGYFQRAFHELRPQDPQLLPSTRDQLEYYYRLGRILHGLEKYPEALSFYQRTIEKGRRENYYFACNAALQAGLVYESLGDTANARLHYETCLSLHPDEYRLGLHQKAKSGLNRLKRQ